MNRNFEPRKVPRSWTRHSGVGTMTSAIGDIDLGHDLVRGEMYGKKEVTPKGERERSLQNCC